MACSAWPGSWIEVNCHEPVSCPTVTFNVPPAAADGDVGEEGGAEHAEIDIPRRTRPKNVRTCIVILASTSLSEKNLLRLPVRASLSNQSAFRGASVTGKWGRYTPQLNHRAGRSPRSLIGVNGYAVSGLYSFRPLQKVGITGVLPKPAAQLLRH